jgi:hypothetical protein
MAVKIRKVPKDNKFDVISQDDINRIINYSKLFKEKLYKYKKMFLKSNEQIHEIDQNLPIGIRNFFLYKYNKIFHKIEMLCKFPQLLIKEWMNLKFNNLLFFQKCHHFSTWLESITDLSQNKVSNLFIQLYRLIYHDTFVNAQLNVSLKNTSKNEQRFHNEIIREVIKGRDFDCMEFPTTRKMMKLHAFNQLIHQENLIYKYNLGAKRKFLVRWLNQKKLKFQIQMMRKIQKLKRQAPYLVYPFDKEWQFNILLIDFPSIDPRTIYLDFLNIKVDKKEINFYDLANSKMFAMLDKFIFSTCIIYPFTWNSMNISEKLSFALSCGFDWRSQLYIDRHTQAKHRMVSELIQKSNNDLKYYKKLRRFCIKIPMIKVEERNWIDIEEKAQPKYTYINRFDDWILNLLASFHYILKYTDENSELRFFMAAHYEHVDDLYIYKEFLKPIEIDDCRIFPS